MSRPRLWRACLTPAERREIDMLEKLIQGLKSDIASAQGRKHGIQNRATVRAGKAPRPASGADPRGEG